MLRAPEPGTTGAKCSRARGESMMRKQPMTAPWTLSLQPIKDGPTIDHGPAAWRSPDESGSCCGATAPAPPCAVARCAPRSARSSSKRDDDELRRCQATLIAADGDVVALQVGGEQATVR